MTINQDFFVDFGAEPDGPVLAHEIRYPGEWLAVWVAASSEGVAVWIAVWVAGWLAVCGCAVTLEDRQGHVTTCLRQGAGPRNCQPADCAAAAA